MSEWEVTVWEVEDDPPRVVGANGRRYDATPKQCDRARQILRGGGTPQATVTDKDPSSGKMLRPPCVLRVT